jgi:hypothetical protein
LPVIGPAVVELAGRVPAGRIHANGRGFMPYKRRGSRPSKGSVVRCGAEVPRAPKRSKRVSLGDAMQFSTSGQERAPKPLISQSFKVRTNSARYTAPEKRSPGENGRAFNAVREVHSLVRKIPPLFGIFTAPANRRIVGLRGAGGGRGTGIQRSPLRPAQFGELQRIARGRIPISIFSICCFTD